MDGSSCDICLLSFNDSSVLPKVLSCGHTICAKCLENILSTNRSCPKCRSTICGTVDSHPTNFALFSLIEKKVSGRHSSDCIQICRAANLENRLELKKKDIEAQKKRVCFNFESLQKNLERIRTITKDNNTNDIDVQITQNMLNSIEDEYKKAVVAEFDVYYKWQSNISATINFKDFGSKDNYLMQIYHHIADGDAVFAMAIVEGRLRYGKVSAQDNLLLIHSLEQFMIPESSITISFEDMKFLSCHKKINCFLKISCGAMGLQHLVQIEIVDSFVAMNFMKFCTGEDGYSYKGTDYVKGEGRNGSSNGILRFSQPASNHPPESNKLICSNFDFFYPENNIIFTQVLEGKMWVLEKHMKEGEEIVRKVEIVDCYRRYNHRPLLGKVVNPKNLKHIVKFDGVNVNKIIDCGIYFELVEP